jgi:Do/DeqQ family serine protease
MDLQKRLSSKSFFIFNLVLLGIIFGFSMAFLSFSCTSPRGGMVAQAQERPSNVVIPQDALAVVEGLQTAFNAVSDKVLPSVVEVTTVTVQRRQSQNFNGIPWEFFFGPNRDGNEDSQGQEYRSRSMGSGIIVRHAADVYYVLTNNHVVEGTTEIVVTTRDGKEYPAELIGTDSRRDLAVISFKTSDTFPTADLGDSDNVRVGDWAIAMGNPLGEQFAFSVTMGIVSAVGRTGGPSGNINDFIQTDASINQGNSGGPLVNIRGEVIGINTWIASNAGGGSVGLGFAIPINNAKRVIDEIIRSGRVSDGWLGVSLTDANRETLQAMGVSGMLGSLAVHVFLGSPADKAGISPGDYITQVDGRVVRGTNYLTQMVGNIRPGDSAVFTVVRDGTTRNFTVQIETRNDTVASDSAKLWPGVNVVALTDDIRSTLNLDRNAQGLYVTQVEDGTPGAIVGLRRGDRITAINNTQIRDMASFYRVLRENADRGEVWFTYIRGETTSDSLRFRK